MIIRHDCVDDDAPTMAAAEFLDERCRPLDLRSRRHERGAIDKRPAMILRVCYLQPARRQRECKINHFADPINIGAMHDCIYRQRQFEAHHLPRQRLFAHESTVVACNVVGGRGAAVLKRNLHVIETRLGKCGEPLCRHADCGRDQVAIEPRIVRSRRELDEIGAGGRFTAGQMDLQYSERGRLLEHALPSPRIEFALAALQGQRV
jgi:hypothetical protein